MNRNFLIEQCRRLEIIHKEESKEANQENYANCKWLLVHNEGHQYLIDKFKKFLEDTDCTDRKVARKWLKKNIKKSDDIIKDLDEKYNEFANDEVMSETDERTYSFNDGIWCIGLTLIEVINKERYISKLK
jgi:hypothetical protein